MCVCELCSVHSFAQAFADCGFMVEYLCVISQLNFIHAIADVRKLYTFFVLMIFPSICFSLHHFSLVHSRRYRLAK